MQLVVFVTGLYTIFVNSGTSNQYLEISELCADYYIWLAPQGKEKQNKKTKQGVVIATLIARTEVKYFQNYLPNWMINSRVWTTVLKSHYREKKKKTIEKEEEEVVENSDNWVKYRRLFVFGHLTFSSSFTK